MFKIFTISRNTVPLNEVPEIQFSMNKIVFQKYSFQWPLYPQSGVNSLSRILQAEKFYTFCVIRQVRDAAPGQSEKKRGQSSESTGANQGRAFRAPTSNFQMRGENSYHSEPRNPSNEKNTLITISGKKKKTFGNPEYSKIFES